MKEFGVSERRACAVIGQPRSTQRYESTRPGKQKALIQRIYELSVQHPRYGYRRIAVLLRREGWKVNTKRVQRLRREEGLQVKRRQTRKRRSGSSENACDRRSAERPNHVWSYDFVVDASEDGKRLKFLTIIDEFTRESLAIRVDRSITADDVMEELAVLFEERGAPEYVRSDNGPEFPRGAQSATRIGLMGAGCPFCGAYWPPPRLILGVDTLAWNYAIEEGNEEMFGPRDKYGVARLRECE